MESETPFRVYRREIGPGGQPVAAVLASADDVSLGELLLDLHRKGANPSGIMYRPVEGEKGEWLINPWGTPPAVASGRLDRATTESTEEDADE